MFSIPYYHLEMHGLVDHDLYFDNKIIMKTYFLTSEQYIPEYDYRYTNNNGVFICYSEDYNYLMNINSYLQLDFLSKLAICGYGREKVDFKWDLSKKYKYEFLIDVYLSNQGGLEESIFLDDLEDGTLFNFYKDYTEKPYFNFKITEVTEVTEVPEVKQKDIIYYNDYQLNYKEFLKIFNTYEYVNNKVTDYIEIKNFT